MSKEKDTQAKKLYLSELISKYNLEVKIKFGAINLIKSPCGSGKTKFIFDYLMKESSGAFNHKHIYYVTDTTMLKEAVKNDYINIIKKEETLTGTLSIIQGCYGEFIKDGIHFCTYATFIDKIINDELFFDTVIFDECHNLANYQEYFERLGNDYINGNYTKLINAIEKKIESSVATKIIALSATPNNFLDLFYASPIEIINVIDDKYISELRSFSNNQQCKYAQNPVEIIKKLNCKSVVFEAGKIERMEKMKNELIKIGINAEFLFSEQNKTKYMNAEQRKLKEFLIKTGKLPEEITVLIINSAYETGWNLYDMSVQAFFYDVKPEYYNEESRYQSRSRIRHDIEYEFVRCRSHDIKKNDKDVLKYILNSKSRIQLLDSVVEKKLTVTEFKNICIQLNFKDNSNHVATGKIAVRNIENLGYIVNKPTNSKRYYMINKQ